MVQENTGRERCRGSVTVEAAVIMPFFICVVVSIIFFVRVVYINEFIRSAALETACDIGTYSYLIHKSGLDERVDDWADEVFEQGRGFVSNENEPFFELLGEITGITPERLAEEAGNHLMMPVVNILMKKNLSGPSGEKADDYLERLGVHDGYDGLDLSRSCFFNGGTEDICLTVGYTVRIPVPLRILGDLDFLQEVRTRAWMGGDMPAENDEDIWSLQNMQRGKKMHEIYGGNLPFDFPGISSFRGGEAVLIRSTDTTTVSYDTPEEVENKIKEYIDEIADYKGQIEPWREHKITIMPEEIKSRRLLQVLPKNKLDDDVVDVLDRCRQYAAARGVVLDIRRYGYKKDAEEQ